MKEFKKYLENKIAELSDNMAQFANGEDGEGVHIYYKAQVELAEEILAKLVKDYANDR